MSASEGGGGGDASMGGWEWEWSAVNMHPIRMHSCAQT